jgi:hypothetical protein
MPRAVHRGACSALLFIAVVCTHGTAAARPIRLHLFNVNPEHTYRVQVNGTDHASTFSGPAGTLQVGLNAAFADVISVIDEGSPDLQPPAPPQFTSLETGDAGCATATWAPSGDPAVVGYVVSFGRNPAQYDQSVDVAAGSSAEVCALEQGMHYFAVQCRNYAGMLSAYSAERAVQIVVVSVLIASFDARVVEEGVALSWRIQSDERLLGFRIYRAGPDGIERSLTPDLIAAGEDAFLDADARPATRYTYAMAAVNEGGEETRSFTIGVETPALTLALGQNLPNPFNPATTIPFVLAASTRVVLRVYDVRGARVATLFDGILPEGRHAIGWDGRNDRGSMVSSGTYLYSLVAGKQRLARKMLMVR